MLSICITAKNRTRYRLPDGNIQAYFTKCIVSCVLAIKEYRKTHPVFPIEFVVTDWGSTDYPILRWLPQALADVAQLTVVQLSALEPFSRGRGLNAAAQHSQYPTLFFLDTDMLLDARVLDVGMTAVANGHAYFPICYSWRDVECTSGYWRTNGKGIAMLNKEVYSAAQRWDEFAQWGSEDQRFYERVHGIVPIERYNQRGLYHMWHLFSHT